MATNLQLTIATGDYAHTSALGRPGWLTVDGAPVTVEHVTDEPAAIFARATGDDLPFDVTEMSLATTYVLADRATSASSRCPSSPRGCSGTPRSTCARRWRTRPRSRAGAWA